MKKLLLCTLILSFVLGNICLAKPINKNKSSTPNWDALEKRKDELLNKIVKLYSNEKLHDLIEQDAQIKEIEAQFKDTKNSWSDLYQKLGQRKKELAYSLNPKLKAYEEEIETMDTKIRKINENPELQNIVNKMMELYKQRNAERAKVNEAMKKESNENDSPADILKRRAAIARNPELAKIEKDLISLKEKEDMLMEKLLIEINKKEAQPKDNTANKGLDQKIKNLQKQKEELMQKDKEIYEARKAALKPGTAGMTMPPHYNEIRAIDEQIKELEKQR